MKTKALLMSLMMIFAVSCGSSDDNDSSTDPATPDQPSNTEKQDEPTIPTDNEPATIPSTLTAMEVASKMYPGWNLGNTMEATGSGLSCETSWQSTKTTQEIIHYVKESGFKSVRIPCSWYIHLSDTKAITIDKQWLSRVKEVVDYCINEDLYVLLNDHWDGGWLEELGFTYDNKTYSAVGDSYVEAKADVLKKIWTQIANVFKDYDEHLIFAGQNEPFQNYSLFDGNLQDKATTLSPILNKYNQAFVDAVRATGGNNALRMLAIQAPGADMHGSQKDAFKIPTDTRENGIMLEFHFYQPWDFSGGDGGNMNYWGKDNKDTKYYSTYAADETYVLTEFAKMKAKFADKGIPMLIGEYGANWRDLSSIADADQAKHDASIKDWYKAINLYGPANGMVPMAWDINSPNRNGKSGMMTIINRTKLEIFGTPAYEGIKEGAAEAVWNSGN
jgi:endoglucanase